MAERPEDLNLPNAVITRIIKEALPDGVNVSKEARRAISQAASVFVLYATSCANNFAMKAKRKTLNMEFERFLEPLREALEVYKKGQKGKKEVSEQKRKDREKKVDSESREEEEEEEEEERMEEEAEGEAEEEEVEN
uniref:DNA polymerase epsilon subunit 3 n=1 Tax=Amphiprion percula TaxID=161767 RepID=A0A3P8RKM8_AMPPE